MIDWSRYFDRIICEFFLPNKDRFERLDHELTRIGIKNSPIFEYSFNVPSCFDNILWQAIKKRPHLALLKPSYVNHLMQRERILRVSLMNGYQRILVLEDDIAFLRDPARIIDILESMPDGYEVYQMDKFLLPSNRSIWNKLEVDNRINKNWVSRVSGRFTSASCIAYTKVGMEEMLRIIETTPGSIDQLAAAFSKRWAISIPHLAIQLVYGNAINLTYMNADRLHSLYSGIVDYQLYNCPEGYPYKRKAL